MGSDHVGSQEGGARPERISEDFHRQRRKEGWQPGPRAGQNSDAKGRLQPPTLCLPLPCLHGELVHQGSEQPSEALHVRAGEPQTHFCSGPRTCGP